MKLQSISTQTLHRIPLYLNYLRSLPKDGAENISATAIAEALGLNDVQVRKDLAQVSSGGRPKIGYITKRLIADIEEFMGYNDTRSAIVAGAGNLGRALFSYGGFRNTDWSWSPPLMWTRPSSAQASRQACAVLR